ncbi:hypothetical protein [Microvirga lotononidis]|uniref:Secreted protein n=1 Tax=Microvirga lotononidis TaxID=864069 RepID=I4Z3A3_9HYPH|nr:hypothetical protein [Microvirga lotononidis]EIM30695.1 hypothetical protein MicloDRAFT_00005980 [Microvirga lotononidis]WQO30341.1 hypothetical protein U0023_29165 [Microvirga lotononidis]
MLKLLIAGLLGVTALSAGGLYANGTAQPVNEAAIRATAPIIVAQAVDEDNEDEDVQPDVQPGPDDQDDQDDQEDIQDDEEATASHPVSVGLG